MTSIKTETKIRFDFITCMYVFFFSYGKDLFYNIVLAEIQNCFFFPQCFFFLCIH